MYESVHGRRWADYKSLLLAHDPTDILLHPALEHLDWISSTEMGAIEPCRELPQSRMDFSHKRFLGEEAHLYLEEEFQDLEEESRDLEEESESLEEESQDLEEESRDLEEEPQDLGKEPQDPEEESQE